MDRQSKSVIKSCRRKCEQRARDRDPDGRAGQTGSEVRQLFGSGDRQVREIRSHAASGGGGRRATRSYLFEKEDSFLLTDR